MTDLSRNASDRPSRVYDPINAYKPLGEELGIVDGPLEYITIAGVRLPVPFSTRMTVVRLASGDLWLHSPTQYDADLARHLSSMGEIRHLVSPNQFHYAHIGEWSRAFPAAITWASPHVRARARARGIEVDFKRDLGAEAPEAWRDEIEQSAIPGGYFGELVFFHTRSRTLILTDTIVNYELEKVPQPWRAAVRMSGMCAPHGQIFFGMRLPFFLQRKKTRAAVERILSWQPERIVIAHGRCFESQAANVIRRLFRSRL